MIAWRAIVERVRVARPSLASVVEHAFPLEVGAARVVIGFDASSGFLAAQAGEPEAIDVLTRAIRAHFDAPTQVVLDVSAKPVHGSRTVAAVEAERLAGELAIARAAVEGHPVVQEAIRLFGAQLRDVKLPKTDE
jgi:hypothetical protein